MQFDHSKQATMSNDQRVNNAFLLQKKNNSKIIKAIKHMDSNDPSTVIKGLNILTQKTYELTDSAAIQLDIFPELILSLGSLLDTVDPIVQILPNDQPYDSYDSFILDRSIKFWSSALPSAGNHEFKLASTSIDDNIMALTVLNIIRNLSFESFNESVISSSAPIMRHLVVILLASIENERTFESAQLAFDILVNIGGRIDTSGRRRLQLISAFLEDVHSDERNKSLHFMRCSEHMSASSTVSYVNSSVTLFPIIHHILVSFNSKASSRYLVLRALELLSKLALVPENSVNFSRSPDSLLVALVDLLCASNSLLDPIVQSTETSAIITGDSAGRTRPPGVVYTAYTSVNSTGSGHSSAQQQAAGASLGGTSFFSADQCDLELRDLVLDCLFAMCQTAPAMQLRLADTPDAIALLCRIAGVSASTASISNYGQAAASSSQYAFQGGNASGSNRSEGNGRSVQILSLLFMLPAVRGRYQAVKADMLVLASADEAVADVVCNKASVAYSYVAITPAAFIADPSVMDGFASSGAITML